MALDFKNWLVTEMPISKFQLQGTWAPGDKRYAYDQKSIGILTNPKAVEKIHRKWSNSQENFDLYFLRGPKVWKKLDVGKVTSEWVKENLGMDIPEGGDTISIIFTNNIGDEKMPLTAWTIAHRLGHAIRRDSVFENYFMREMNQDFNELINELFPETSTAMRAAMRSYYYPGNSISPLHIALNVGVMKSARDGNLRNFQEFMFEVVAQYITTGKVVFKPLTKTILMQKKFAWGKPNHEVKRSSVNDETLVEVNEMLRGFAEKYEDYLHSIFVGLVGHIYVM